MSFTSESSKRSTAALTSAAPARVTPISHEPLSPPLQAAWSLTQACPPKGPALHDWYRLGMLRGTETQVSHAARAPPPPGGSSLVRSRSGSRATKIAGAPQRRSEPCGLCSRYRWSPAAQHIGHGSAQDSPLHLWPNSPLETCAPGSFRFPRPSAGFLKSLVACTEQAFSCALIIRGNLQKISQKRGGSPGLVAHRGLPTPLTHVKFPPSTFSSVRVPRVQ
jgi:hypothetical protein